MTQYEIYQLTILLFGIFQWLTIPFAITHDAVRDLSTNYSTVWVKELDPKLSGYYIDSFLRLIFGGIGWQVRFRFLNNKYI